jgi:glycosyltransferase involved in cell wall biosynthesis
MSEDKRLHVTLVTSHFHPDYSATGQLLTELAVGLDGMGCEVSVFTARPTYANRPVPRFEVHEGVEVHRVISTSFDKNLPIGRIFNSCTYFLSVSWGLLWRSQRGPLLIVSNPPFLGLVGYLLRLLRGRPFVYLIHDVFPDAAVTLGYLKADGWVSRIWDRVNRLVLTHASRIVVLGEGTKTLIARKGGDGVADRIRVIHNWVDEAFIRPLPKSENPFVREHGLEGRFVVLYAGNLGLGQDLETVIGAAERVRDRDMVFLFIGEGGKKKKLQAMVQERGLDNVRFLPYQPRDVLPYSATCSDVSLVALERGVEGLSMPSKLYTIMASGRPVVAIVEKGLEVARIVAEGNCGESVEPGDVDGLVRVLDHYGSNPEICERDGRNGRAHFQAHFTRTLALREYFEVLESARPDGNGTRGAQGAGRESPTPAPH